MRPPKMFSVMIKQVAIHPGGFLASVWRLWMLFCPLTLEATNPTTWQSRSEEHWRAFEKGDQFLAFGDRAKDRFSNEIAHLIGSYLALHSVSGETKWISEAARQLDEILGRTDTWHRSGVGWSTPRYSANLIQNGSGAGVVVTDWRQVFSEGFDVAGPWGFPPEWRRVQATASTAYRDAAAGKDGTGCLVLVADGVNWVSADRAGPELKANTHYEVEFEGWTYSINRRREIDVRVGDTSTWIPTTPLSAFPSGVTNEWRKFSIQFRNPAFFVDSIRVRLVIPSCQIQGARLKIENLTVREVTKSRLANWENLNGPASNVLGGDAITLKNNGTTWQAVGQRLYDPWVAVNANYQPGARYRVRFQAQTTPGIAAVATVLNGRIGRTIAPAVNSTVTWREFELNFYAPTVPGEDVWLLLYPNSYASAGETASFRAVDIRQYAGLIIDEALVINAMLEFVRLGRTTPHLSTEHATRIASYLVLARTIADQWNRDWVENENFGTFRYADDGAASVFPAQRLLQITSQRQALATYYYTS